MQSGPGRWTDTPKVVLLHPLRPRVPGNVRAGNTPNRLQQRSGDGTGGISCVDGPY